MAFVSRLCVLGQSLCFCFVVCETEYSTMIGLGMVSSLTVWQFKRKRTESPETMSGLVAAVHRTSTQKLEQTGGSR